MRNVSRKRSMEKAGKSGRQAKARHLALQPDALGVATRFAAVRLLGTRNFTIGLRYAGVATHPDRQQMECLVTWLIRFCRESADRRLNPIAVHFVHRRCDASSELEKFFGCRIEFGADRDQVIFDKQAKQLRLAAADPYLNEMLLEYCEQAPRFAAYPPEKTCRQR